MYTPEAYLVSLQTLIAKGYEWIVVTDDETLKLLKDTLDDDTARRILPFSKRESMQVIGSKAGLERACQRCGIPTPRSFILQNGDIEKALQNLTFPLLLKLDYSWGGKGIHLCSSKDQLVART